jgi:hypothetical protein
MGKIKIKRLFLLIVLCRISTCMFAQGTDSLIEIKGYYVERLLKQEMVFEYEQCIKKERGELYVIPIDYSNFSFFIPVQVGNNIVCEKKEITDFFLNFAPYKQQYDSVYVMPNSKSDNDFLRKMNIVITDVSKEICISNLCWNLSPYYEIEGNNEYLFKCIYIEGYALRKHFYEIEKDWQYLFCHHFNNGNKCKENTEFFFIVKINNYTPYIEVPNLKKWLPYLEDNGD